MPVFPLPYILADPSTALNYSQALDRALLQIKGTPCIHKVLFRACRGGQASSLTHGATISGAKRQNALQALSHSSNRSFNEEAVVAILKQIFHPVELRDHNRKAGGGSLIRYQRERLVKRWKHKDIRAPQVGPDIRLHTDKLDPVTKLIPHCRPTEARDQIRFAAHNDQLDPLHAFCAQRLEQQWQSLTFKLSQGHKQGH